MPSLAYTRKQIDCTMQTAGLRLGMWHDLDIFVVVGTWHRFALDVALRQSAKGYCIVDVPRHISDLHLALGVAESLGKSAYR